MTPSERRWAILVFAKPEDLSWLHVRECKRCNIDYELGQKQLSPIGWEDNGAIEKITERAGLDPYWPTNMPQQEQKNRMDDFCKAIFPLWKNVAERCGPDVDEKTKTHLQDIAIFKSGKQPNRASGSGFTMEQARRGGQ